ncbi:MAG: methionyl-tRNA formyltransferase [Chloroflexi bacterium]|nr:methionyl-tRNA formyltransferase [Chloroflexota bacterium]
MPRIVFMGTPDFALPALERLAAGPYDLVAVYTQPDRPSGRGRQLAETPVKRWALEHKVDVHTPLSFRKPDVLEELRALRPDVLVVAAYGRLLPPPVLAVAPRGAVNIHPSLLPRYRGPSPVTAAILVGDVRTGATIMLLDEGMDSGPILSQIEMPIGAEDTTGTLTAKLALAGADLLMQTLPRWLDGQITPRPQDAARAIICAKVEKEHGRIDWSRQALEIERAVRAYQPWPGAYTQWQGKQIKVLRATAATGSGVPGSVSIVDAKPEKAIAIATGSGTLFVAEVQLEGKRPMRASEFLAGHQAIVGATLG